MQQLLNQGIQIFSYKTKICHLKRESIIKAEEFFLRLPVHPSPQGRNQDSDSLNQNLNTAQQKVLLDFYTQNITKRQGNSQLSTRGNPAAFTKTQNIFGATQNKEFLNTQKIKLFQQTQLMSSDKDVLRRNSSSIFQNKLPSSSSKRGLQRQKSNLSTFERDMAPTPTKLNQKDDRELVNNLVDFELMKKIHTQCQLEEDDQNGLCSECMLEHFVKEHNLISIEDQIKHVQTVLLGLEQNLQEILKSKTNILKKHEAQIAFLNETKKQFLAEQRAKIDSLKQYLDDRYLHIVCQYNIAYEKDVLGNKSKIDTVSQKIKENLGHVKKIQSLREEFITLANHESQQRELLKGLINPKPVFSFEERVRAEQEQSSIKSQTAFQQIKKPSSIVAAFLGERAQSSLQFTEIETIESKIIKNFVKTGTFLDKYNQMKEKKLAKEKLEADMIKANGGSELTGTRQIVFSRHSLNCRSLLSVDVEKEIAILTRKFKDLNFKQEQVNQLIQKYERPERVNPDGDDSFDMNSKKQHKITIPRWFSKKMAEFDFDRDLWQGSGIKGLDLPIFPFSSISYSSEMNEFFLLGGFNNKVESKSSFSSRVLKISEEKVNPFESIYNAKLLSPMRKQRGCFPSSILITKKYKVRAENENIILTEEEAELLEEQEQDAQDGKKRVKEAFEGYIFAIGGKNREDKLLKQCESYDIKTNLWSQIASLNESRMNASSCAFSLSEGLFVFGGEDLDGYFLNSIEQYLINENRWITLEIQFPQQVCSQITYKVSKRKILLLGGMKLVESSADYASKERSSDVFSFNVQLGILKHCKENSLKEPVFSLYPCFQITEGGVGNLIRTSYVNTSRPVTRTDVKTANTNNHTINQGGASGSQIAKEDKTQNECCIYLVNEAVSDAQNQNPHIIAFPVVSFLPGGDNY